jgi:hypothetical protein
VNGLSQAFVALRNDLVREDGPQISTMRNYRYAIVPYAPEQEFELREHVQQLVGALTAGGWVVKTISLQHLLMQCLQDAGEDVVARVMQVEEQVYARSAERGLAHLKTKLDLWLNDERTGIAARVSRELESFALEHADQAERSLVLIGRAGALYPFFRVSTLLKRLENGERLPVVLLYPGKLHPPTGLSFMGELTPDGDYRPRIYS